MGLEFDLDPRSAGYQGPADGPRRSGNPPASPAPDLGFSSIWITACCASIVVTFSSWTTDADLSLKLVHQGMESFVIEQPPHLSFPHLALQTFNASRCGPAGSSAFQT